MDTRAFGVALLAFGLACGGSSVPPAATNLVQGSIAGQTFAAGDASSVAGSWKGFDFNGTSLAVSVSDFGGLCTYETNHQQPAGTQIVTFVLASNDASGSSTRPAGTGEFVVAAPNALADARAAGALRAQVWFEKGASGPSGSFACFRDTTHWASTGKVILTANSEAAVSGTFDIVLDSGDHLSGSFNAPACPGATLNSSLACP